jgi:hypothetical protein
MVPRFHVILMSGGKRADPTLRKEMKAALYQCLGHNFLFGGHSSEDVMAGPPPLKRPADRSEGIIQQHKETTVCAGHGSPR